MLEGVKAIYQSCVEGAPECCTKKKVTLVVSLTLLVLSASLMAAGYGQGATHLLGAGAVIQALSLATFLALIILGVNSEAKPE